MLSFHFGYKILKCIHVNCSEYDLLKMQAAVANNESEEAIIDIKYEISLLNLELAKYKYLNQLIKSTDDQLNRSTVSMNKYSDKLLKLYIRSIKVTNKEGLSFKIDADSVILSTGYKSAPLTEKGKHIHIVGDAKKVGNLRTVIWGAWDVCMKL